MRMGMYCCCKCKIKLGEEWENRCTCNWDGWISIYDFPPTRKNKNLPFALPVEDGKYLTRYQNNSGDHYEVYQYFQKIPRKSKCVFTGLEVFLHWSGRSNEQPYAWAELYDDEITYAYLDDGEG